MPNQTPSESKGLRTMMTTIMQIQTHPFLKLLISNMQMTQDGHRIVGILLSPNKSQEIKSKCEHHAAKQTNTKFKEMEMRTGRPANILAAT